MPLPVDVTSIFVRLIYLCLLLIIVSWVWAILSVQRYRLKRSARGVRQQLGQVFEERFEVENQSRLPRPWLAIKDEAELPGSGGSRVLSRIGSLELRNYSAYTLLVERGEFQLGPTSLISGDPFGLFAIFKEVPGERNLLVLPYMVDIHKFPFPPGLLPGGRAKRQKTTDITPHAAGVREYATGDALNRIHWPTTVRRDRLMVKEFEQDPQADVWIFLDAQRDVHHSTGTIQQGRVDQFWMWRHKEAITLPQDTFEYGVSIAASVGRYFIHRGQSVGLGCLGQRMISLPPERGDRQLGKILENLALIKPMGKIPLIGLIENTSGFLLRGSIVVVITSATDDGVAMAIDTLVFRGLKPVVVLVNPATFGARTNSDGLNASLQKRGVPVATLDYGENLVDTLENGFFLPSNKYRGV